MPAVDDATRVAAFFDLDKTVIAKASMVAFSRPLHRAGMLTRRLMVKAAWGQLVYAQIGASPEKLEKLRESVLQLTKGWDQAEVSAIVRDTIGDVIEPIVYDEALDRIRAHQRWGHKVFIVSASPEEVVAPIAQLIGVDEAIATRAELDEHGRYSGRTERYVYAEEKVAAMTEVAERDGLDLDHCWAYSDSATDIPMLAAVGHPVAVNPDRELARAARERGWQVEQFRLEVPLRERVPMPAPRQRRGGRQRGRRGRRRGWRVVVVAPERCAYSSRTFLAAMEASATKTMRMNSFFMPQATGCAGLDREEVASAGVAARVAQLRHGAGLDLADALPGQVEVLADLFERAGLAAVEAEPELQDLALTVVEGGEQPVDLIGEQRGGGHLEGGLGGPVLDDVAELGVAVLTERLAESDSGSAAKRRASVTLSSGISTSAESSARVAGRPSFSSSRARAFWRRASVSPAWTGRRIVRPVLAMPRVIAWRIHQVAYVENLKPLRQSNFSTACIRPRLPSWMRSRSGSPDAWYFLAIETTSRRFDCTNVRSAVSPARAVRRSSRLRAGRDLLAAVVQLGAGFVPRLDGLRQPDLVVLGQERILTDVGEVEADEVFLVALDALLGHRQPSWS